MNVSGIYSYANVLQNAEVNNKRHNKNGLFDTETNDRNAGPDTVSLSSEAIEKYLAMKSSSDSPDQNEKGADNPPETALFGQAAGSGKKNGKMTRAELLAFMKSDTFAEEAIGYAKAATMEKATSQNDDEEESDQILRDMGAKKRADGNADGGSTGGASTEATDETRAKGGFGGPVVNGKRVDEKELAAEIHRIEEEINDLTATYELIMGGQEEFDEKVRLSQPVHKRIDERFKDLQALKEQAEMLKQEKLMETA